MNNKDKTIVYNSRRPFTLKEYILNGFKEANYKDYLKHYENNKDSNIIEGITFHAVSRVEEALALIMIPN